MKDQIWTQIEKKEAARQRAYENGKFNLARRLEADIAVLLRSWTWKEGNK